MGIKQLLCKLTEGGAGEQCTLGAFEGKILGIDASCWLHRGCMGCAAEVAQGIDTDGYYHFFMKFLRMVKFFKAIPVVVFDGRSTVMKEGEEEMRREKRSQNRQLGLEALRKAKQFPNDAKIHKKAAYDFFQKACSITLSMRNKVLAELKKDNVRFIVAPGEADAQLAHLALCGAIDGVISEDSDILVYLHAAGATHVPLITKLKDDSTAYVIKSKSGAEAAESVVESQIVVVSPSSDEGDMEEFDFTVDAATDKKAKNKKPKKRGETFMDVVRQLSNRQYVQMGILSGCDYVDSVSGVGVVSAAKLVKHYGHTADHERFGAIVEHLKQFGVSLNTSKPAKKEKGVPGGYLDALLKAEATFYHHPVYSNEGGVMPLTAPLLPQIDLTFLQSTYTPEEARLVCIEGVMDPKTKRRVPLPAPPSAGKSHRGKGNYNQGKTSSNNTTNIRSSPFTNTPTTPFSAKASNSRKNIFEVSTFTRTPATTVSSTTVNYHHNGNSNKNLSSATISAKPSQRNTSLMDDSDVYNSDFFAELEAIEKAHKNKAQQEVLSRKRVASPISLITSPIAIMQTPLPSSAKRQVSPLAASVAEAALSRASFANFIVNSSQPTKQPCSAVVPSTSPIPLASSPSVPADSTPSNVSSPVFSAVAVLPATRPFPSGPSPITATKAPATTRITYVDDEEAIAKAIAASLLTSGANSHSPFTPHQKAYNETQETFVQSTKGKENMSIGSYATQGKRKGERDSNKPSKKVKSSGSGIPKITAFFTKQ